MFLSPLLAFGIWYGVSFHPYTGKIENLANYGNGSAEVVMPDLYQYAVAAETEYGIRAHASRQAYWHLVSSKKRTSTLSRHMNSLLWYVASHITFDNKEIFGVWVACSVSQCGKGLPVASKEYFGKELVQMNQHELLGLVAMVKSPSAYKPGSEHSEKRIEYILRNLKTHNTSLHPTKNRFAVFVG
jgi:hypothetical protein